jgi:hypothetical protein
MTRQRSSLALALSVTLAFSTCGGGKKQAARPRPTTTTSSTTTAPVPTTAAVVEAAVAPLTGLPQPDAARRQRVALVVKIDNAPKARPPTGLDKADVVVEEKVEDGVTRFFAIFQSADADPVGPVRSARTTDITLVTPLHRPLFAYSGTNATFQAQVNAAPLVDVGINKAPGEYRRHADRPAPYNLYTNTSRLFGRAPIGSQAPPPLFSFRPAGAPLDGAGAAPATTLHVEYRGIHITTIVDYAWDAGSGTWRRTLDGRPHTDTDGPLLAPKNVVVQFVEYRDTGQRDRSNTVVPEAQLLGSGEAWVLSGGAIVKGRWSKPSASAVTTYTDSAGAPIALTPGQTWVELAPPGSAR